jgi:hypothetical protein
MQACTQSSQGSTRWCRARAAAEDPEAHVLQSTQHPKNAADAHKIGLPPCGSTPQAPTSHDHSTKAEQSRLCWSALHDAQPVQAHLVAGGAPLGGALPRVTHACLLSNLNDTTCGLTSYVALSTGLACNLSNVCQFEARRAASLPSRAPARTPADTPRPPAQAAHHRTRRVLAGAERRRLSPPTPRGPPPRRARRARRRRRRRRRAPP